MRRVLEDFNVFGIDVYADNAFVSVAQLRWCKDHGINLAGTTRRTYGFPPELRCLDMPVLIPSRYPPYPYPYLTRFCFVTVAWSLGLDDDRRRSARVRVERQCIMFWHVSYCLCTLCLYISKTDPYPPQTGQTSMYQASRLCFAECAVRQTESSVSVQRYSRNIPGTRVCLFRPLLGCVVAWVRGCRCWYRVFDSEC